MDKQALFYAGGKFMRGSLRLGCKACTSSRCTVSSTDSSAHITHASPNLPRPPSSRLQTSLPQFPPPTIILLSSIVFSEHLVIPFIFPGRTCPCPYHYPSFPTGTPRFPSLPQDLRYSFPFGTTVSLLPRNDFARPLRDHICMLLSNAGSPLGFSAPILHRRIMYKFTYVYLC